MKNIAVFCDGTWQHLDQRYPTNVALLARCVAPADVGGRAQVVYYDDGVGVSQGVSGLSDLATHLLGGGLGQGLDYKVAHAYEFICLNYAPGDRIFIFGFSRGAYTARSLAGLLRWAWIMKRENASHAFEAMGLYRSRPAKNSDANAEQAFQTRMQAFRAANSYPSAAFVDAKAYDPKDPATLLPNDTSSCAWLQYVGVWDTVGSLGIPDNLPLANAVNAQYQFWDTSLSRFVRSARHAVSIDEKRKTFTPTLWDNIDSLNANAGAQELDYGRRPYQQTWFPGGHGAVGGGGADGGLSLPPMLWIAEGAARAGLAFSNAELAAYAALAHPDAKFQEEPFSLGSVILKAVGMEDRVGPQTFDEVSLSARLRAKRLPYDPPPLQHGDVPQHLRDFQPQPDPQAWYLP
jgi:uncharacterized protein (DUF2235 family)